MRKAPLISVITITLDDLAGLVHTVASVENQKYKNYEHLVVDGMSSDGTVDFCVATKKRLSNFSYTSEKDDGIYDAMNKGARLARGELLVFVNSSDGLTEPSVLDFVAERWSQSEDWQWGYGAVRYTDADGVPFAGTVQAPFRFHRFKLGRQHIPHPASYVSRTLFLQNGGFDESFGTAADQEFFVRVCQKYPPAVWIRFLADFMIGGVHSEETIWQRERMWHLMRVKNGCSIANNRFIDRAVSIFIYSTEIFKLAIRKLFKFD